jgi:hypothetical protein
MSNDFTAPVSRQCKNLAAMWHVRIRLLMSGISNVKTCSGYLSERSERIQMKLLTCYQLHTQWFCFWGQVPYLFLSFCLSVDILNVWHLHLRLHQSWTWQTIPKLAFSPHSALNSYKLSAVFHSQFTAKAVADTLLCLVFNFPGTCKSQLEEEMLVLNVTLLSSSRALCGYSSSKSLGRLQTLLYGICIWPQQFVVAAVLQYCCREVSSETIWLHM